MKKLSKILVVLLSVAVLVAAAVLAVSAEETVIDGTYAVDGVGYDSWADAVAAAGGTKTIYLNEDVTVSSSYSIKSKVTLDLNSHKITSTKTDYTTLFDLSESAEFSLIGEGSIVTNRLATAVSGTKLCVNGLGGGINIAANANIDTLIWIKGGASAEFSGDIIFTPYKLNGRFVQVSDSATSLAAVKYTNVSLDAARITVNEPSNDVRHSTTYAIYFAWLYEGAQLTIANNSVVNMVYGNMFSIAGSSSYGDKYYTAEGTGDHATKINSAPIDLTIRIDVDDSKLYANNSGYSVLKHNSFAGLFLGGAYKGIYMTMDNVDFVACNRTIAGVSYRDNYNVASGKIEFNNVNYKSSDNVAYESSWLVSERVNIKWNGGTIDHKTGLSATYNADPAKDKASVKIPKQASGDPFGADAIAAAKAKGVDISPETHRVVMYDGTNYNGKNVLDEWSYYAIYEPKAYASVCVNGLAYAEYVAIKDANGNITGYKIAEAGETPDTWFGVKFENVAFVTAPVAPSAAPKSGASCYTLAGTKYDNVKIPTGLFETATYAVGYFTELPKDQYNLNATYSSIYNPTSAWYRKPTAEDDSKATASGTRPSDSIVEAARDFGTAEAVVGASGKNGYFKWSVDTAANDATSRNDSTADPYVEMKTGLIPSSAVVSYNASNNTITVTNDKASDYAVQNYKYIVQEFDVATDGGIYPTVGSSIITRCNQLYYDASKTSPYYASIAQVHYGINATKFTGNGVVSSELSGNNNLATMTSADKSYQLPTDGTWSRFTYVFEIKGWIDNYDTYKVNGIERARSRMQIDLHVYINGEWRTTVSNFFTPVDSEFKSTLMIDSIRFNLGCIDNSSILIDNTRLSYYKADDKACADIAKITANPTAKIVDNPQISIMPDNNTYYDAKPVGTVDGKEYKSEKELLNAVKPGSVIELSQDIESVLPVSSSNKIVLNGHSYAGFASATHVARKYGNVINFVAADASEIVKVHFKDDDFGVDDATSYATLGSTIGAFASSDASIYKDGYLMKIVGWKTTSGSSVIAAGDVVDGVVLMSSVRDSIKYYYTISVDGKISYYFEGDAQAIAANVQSVLTEGKTVVVVLWSDIDVTTGTYKINKNATLYFDLNGCKYIAARSSGANMFEGYAGSNLYLYSSKEGGAIVNVLSLTGTDSSKGKDYVRVTGSPIWYTRWDEKADNSAIRASFGTVKNEALGINADGKNLTVIASMIADVRTVETSKLTASNGFTDVNGDGTVDYKDIKNRAVVNIDGGNYVRFTMGGWAMFAACGPLDLNINNASIIGVSSLFSTHSTYHATSMNLNVNNSTVISIKNKFTGTEFEQIFNQFDNSTAVFTNSVISGTMKNPTAGTVTLGRGVALVSADNMSANYQLGEGLMMAKANYSVTTKTPMNYLTYSFTVDGKTENYDLRDTWGNTLVEGKVTGAVFNKELSVWTEYVDVRQIAVYIDSPENLAHLTWYDIDNTTVLGETYNAPKGEIVVDPDLYKSVSISYGNEWYNVSFTKWALPELKAGELAVVPVCETPVANVTCLDVNITLYTNFRLNYYLPVNNEEGFSLVGIAKDSEGLDVLASEIVEIDGVSYIRFSEFVSAAAPAGEVRYIVFSCDGISFAQEVSFGVEDYVTEILVDADGKYTLNDKTIVANVVRYANEYYKLAVDAAGYAAYNALLEDNSAKLLDITSYSAEELNVDVSDLAGVVEDIIFYCGMGRPTFTVIYKDSVAASVKLPDAPDGGFAKWPENNKGIFTYVNYLNYAEYEREMLLFQNSVDSNGEFTTGAALENGAWANGDAVVAMYGDMLVEDLTSVITIVVYNADGTVVRGTYSLAAYINSASNEESACAKALYALSVAAQDYVKATYNK